MALFNKRKLNYDSKYGCDRVARKVYFQRNKFIKLYYIHNFLRPFLQILCFLNPPKQFSGHHQLSNQFYQILKQVFYEIYLIYFSK